MRKFFLSLPIIIAMLLTGCLPQVQATPTSTPTSSPRPTPTFVPTVLDEASIQPGAGCTVVTKQPAPGPTAESIFPPVGDTDWVKGPANARVTIVEYSDFQ